MASLLNKFADATLEQTKKYSDDCDAAREKCFKSKEKLNEAIAKYRFIYYGAPIAMFVIIFMCVAIFWTIPPNEHQQEFVEPYRVGRVGRVGGRSSRQQQMTPEQSKWFVAVFGGLMGSLATYVLIRQYIIVKYAPNHDLNCMKYKHIPFCGSFTDQRI